MKKVFMVVMLTMLGISFMGVSAAVATDECGPVGTGTPGYWKNHPDAWPVDELWFWVNYVSQEDIIELMDQPVKNDKWLTMFKAYVAAKLNVLNGNCQPVCLDPTYGRIDLGDGYNWLRDCDSPVRANSECWQYSHGEAIYWCLDDYNNGRGDMPSRDALE
jgi:hypothetical protein